MQVLVLFVNLNFLDIIFYFVPPGTYYSRDGGRAKSRHMYKGPTDKDQGVGGIESGRWERVIRGREMCRK